MLYTTNSIKRAKNCIVKLINFTWVVTNYWLLAPIIIHILSLCLINTLCFPRTRYIWICPNASIARLAFITAGIAFILAAASAETAAACI